MIPLKKANSLEAQRRMYHRRNNIRKELYIEVNSGRCVKGEGLRGWSMSLEGDNWVSIAEIPRVYYHLFYETRVEERIDQIIEAEDSWNNYEREFHRKLEKEDDFKTFLNKGRKSDIMSKKGKR